MNIENSYRNLINTVGDPGTALKKTKAETDPYNIIFAGRKITVLPGVFSPKYFNDSVWFAKNLPIKTGDNVLEIGTGTGAISITLIDRGADKVLATDINPIAVENAKLNVLHNALDDRIEVRQGDVFSPVKEEEKFDVIFWNVPFIYTEDTEEIPDLEKALFDPGYKSYERYIKDAVKHLKNNGNIYIAFSSTIGRMDIIEEITKKAGMSIEKIVGTTGWELENAPAPTPGRPIAKLEIFKIVQN